MVIAQAGVATAQAQLGQAQAALDLLRAGAREQEILLLEANVAQARAYSIVPKPRCRRSTLSLPASG
jgi:hypothetical protein